MRYPCAWQRCCNCGVFLRANFVEPAMAAWMCIYVYIYTCKYIYVQTIAMYVSIAYVYVYTCCIWTRYVYLCMQCVYEHMYGYTARVHVSGTNWGGTL